MQTSVAYRTRYTRFADSESIDSFGRMRISAPFTIFDSTLQYDTSPLWWDTSTSGGASAYHLPNQSSVQLAVGTGNGDRIYRQTRKYIRYQPGKSQLVDMTGTLGASIANVRRRIGYYDDQNGIFFEQSSGSVFVVGRSFSSGSVIDTKTSQSSWNVDKMDGTGQSGIVLDLSKSQIFSFDLEWLGVGRVRHKFVIDGLRWTIHESLYSNVSACAYMTTANLPLRYEIDNIGNTAASSGLVQICAAVVSEGGVDERGVVLSATNGSTLVSVSTILRPVLSIRVSGCLPSGGSIINRESVIPLSYKIFSQDSEIHYRILHNPSLSAANFVAANASYSGVDFDVSSSILISSGMMIDSGYVAAAQQSSEQIVSEISNDLQLTQNALATQGDILSIVAVRVGTANSDVGVVINWKELY